MKRTQQTATTPAAAPEVLAAQPPARRAPTPTPLHAPHRPTEHTLVAKIMERATREERDVLYELLDDCANTGLPLAQACLRVSSHALGLHLFVEDIEDYVKDFNGLTKVMIDNGWLYRFLSHVFTYINEGKSMTPEDVMELVEMDLLQLEGNLDCAKEVIRQNPEAVAKEIREAVATHPYLLSNAS